MPKVQLCECGHRWSAHDTPELKIEPDLLSEGLWDQTRGEYVTAQSRCTEPGCSCRAWRPNK
jgi:hypothetical protein